jgi:hypothetical protein
MRKTLGDLSNLSHVAVQSHFRTASAAYNSLGAYSPSNIAAWLTHVGAYWLKPRHKFLSYAPPETGVYTMPDYTKIGMAADWGTGTNEAEKVALQIKAANPDYTIHLGDIYYTGSEQEVDENFLGFKVSDYEPVAWPRGSKGTFALCGNHEMYTNGNSYYDVLLPELDQKASYFCIQNSHWRIIGIDTAYNSTGLDLGPFKPSCKIPDENMKWLANLKLEDDQREIVVLSHYQPWSSFEKWYSEPAKQLSSFIKKPFLWFWGHEHRMGIYNRYTYNGVTAYGRLIGNGGMPVPLKLPDNSKCFCSFTDAREYPNSEGLKIGYNGCVMLNFSGDSLHVGYLDLNGFLVREEIWTTDKLI